MKNNLFRGTATALVTPFHLDGSVNHNEFSRMVVHQLNSGVDALLIAGTTGEGSTLTLSEKLDLIRLTKEICKGRVQIIAGAGNNNTATCVHNAKAMENAGADALLVITPYYNKTTQRGLVQHFATICNATSLPVIVYNVPSRTGMTIEPNTYYELCEIENIMGIKDASANLGAFANIKKLCKDRLRYYCGSDELNLPFLSLGGDGVISVVSNIIPLGISSLCKAYFEENYSKAAELQLKYTGLINAIFTEVSPIPIKAALNIIGYSVGNCRLPLSIPQSTTYSRLEKELKELDMI